jgi:GNAT superfamily N-acetyltransferase
MEPNPQLVALFGRITGLKWRCERCGATTQRLRAYSLTASGGDLYVVEIPQSGVDLKYLHLLCSPCWGKMLQWNAQLGFDIHTHARTESCESNCLTRRKGRMLQYASLAKIERRRGFEIIKAIDGQPRVNGTQIIFACRAGYFQGGGYARQMYYESISDPAELGRQIASTEKLRWSGVPMYMLDSHLLAVEWFESSYAAPGGEILQPRPGEKSIGFHCIAVEGYDPETEIFRFWNSWGPNWGNWGYGRISLEYVRRYYHEAFVTRHARWGPAPAKASLLEGTKDNLKELRRVWIIENPRYRYRVRGRGRKIEIIQYYTVSPTFGDPVVCFELKTGFGLRIGWLFLRHSSVGRNYSEITELYIWPIYRRMGLGSWLESAAVDEAQIQGSSEIRLLMNEADCVIGPPRSAARKFAGARGYALRWRNTVAPKACATGIKAI